jgi:hypothetical protein
VRNQGTSLNRTKFAPCSDRRPELALPFVLLTRGCRPMDSFQSDASWVAKTVGEKARRDRPRRKSTPVRTRAASCLVSEHTGLEGANVVRVKRITKGTSGKVQRHVLERAQISGDFDTELEELDTLIAASVRSAGIFESGLEALCNPSASRCWREDASMFTTTCLRSAPVPLIIIKNPRKHRSRVSRTHRFD